MPTRCKMHSLLKSATTSYKEPLQKHNFMVAIGRFTRFTRESLKGELFTKNHQALTCLVFLCTTPPRSELRLKITRFTRVTRESFEGERFIKNCKH